MEAIDETVLVQTYPAYKDSGIDWLGKIPEHWEVIRLKRIALSVSQKVSSKESSLTYIGMENIESWTGKYLNSSTEIEGLANYFQEGDILFGKLRPYLAKVYLSKNEGLCSTEFLVLKSNSNLHRSYLHKILLSPLFIDLINSSTYGSKMPRASWDFIGEQKVPLPPLEEQTRIAHFLDRKTAQIDQAIAQKERLIELLNERRQMLIHRAVTRGLDPNVPLKDSGIDWIGKIPTHWEVIPLTKYASRVDYRGKTPEKVEEGVFLVTTRNIKDGKIDYEISKEYVQERQYKEIMSRGIPKVGDILFTMEAPLGMSAVVDDPTVAVAQRIIKFSFVCNSFDSHFVNYSMQTQYFQTHLQQEGTGSTAVGIKASKLHKLKLLKPPFNEQSKIAEFINAQEMAIQRASNQQKQQIQKIQELKATLINSAVTGKIKV